MLKEFELDIDVFIYIQKIFKGKLVVLEMVNIEKLGMY